MLRKGLLSALALGLTTITAEAASPKILDKFTEVDETANYFTVNGKASGLAGGFTYTVQLTGSISGSAQCVNPGGNPPPPKDFTLTVTASGDFTAQRNGNLLFFVLQPMVVDPDCPNPNWSVLVTYSGTINIELYDAASNLLDTQVGVQVSFP